MISASSQTLLASVLLGTEVFAAAVQARLSPRREPADGPWWDHGFGEHRAYPNSHGHGKYQPGEWGRDEYHGWHWPNDEQGGDVGYNAYVDVPTTTPEHACPPVDPDFIGFAFEEASLPRYVQNRDGSVNQFSLNLIDAIMSRTGGKPIVRLGGTSADYGRFIPSQQAAALPPSEVYNYQDLPMAHTNVSESVLWAKTAAAGIGIERIDAFEPGNEADLYMDDYGDGALGPPYYQGTLTNESYTGNFTKYVSAVKQALGITEPQKCQAFDTAAHLGDDVLANGYILDVQTNFELGINNGNDIKQVAHHYYQTDGGEYDDLGTGLMQHSAIIARLDLLRKFITYLRDNHPRIPFIISEVGNSLNPTHSYDYQATLGSALWSVDFQLYSMSIGIARINWQQIMHSGFDMWLPVDSGNSSRRVFSNFYPMPLVADFIGNTGSIRAVQLETGQDDIVAYAAYVENEPVRVAIINLNIWDGSDGYPRPSTAFTLGVPIATKELRVDVLGSPHGAHASGDSITYAGSQWTSASEGTEVTGVRNDSMTLKVEGGEANVVVHNSEAVLIHLL
ncbi:hypothetical protein LTR37_006131 [Vermiconidia calcicola]|uniref:Uncharacterized protein n=1 Tax=Vermiconidia calcicola TaxID=1690605 RepID=A0ACC3NGZ1_9PEZI|nr:hypothetical protein LTR37_006131 [Vermiconidia calcicola]